MYQTFSATDFDLRKTMAIFRSIPNQGVKFGSVEELKRIEAEVTDYLLWRGKAGAGQGIR
jgi:hypothetical protein